MPTLMASFVHNSGPGPALTGTIGLSPGRARNPQGFTLTRVACGVKNVGVFRPGHGRHTQQGAAEVSSPSKLTETAPIHGPAFDHTVMERNPERPFVPSWHQKSSHSPHDQNGQSGTGGDSSGVVVSGRGHIIAVPGVHAHTRAPRAGHRDRHAQGGAASGSPAAAAASPTNHGRHADADAAAGTAVPPESGAGGAEGYYGVVVSPAGRRAASGGQGTAAEVTQGHEAVESPSLARGQGLHAGRDGPGCGQSRAMTRDSLSSLVEQFQRKTEQTFPSVRKV